MKSFAKFMASAFGRTIRVVAGAGIIAWGILGMGDSNGLFVAGLGVLPIFTGLMNICIIAPLLGAPLKGVKS